MSSQLIKHLCVWLALCSLPLAGVTITRQPQDTNVPLGVPTYLQVEASGLPSISYQWFKDGMKLSAEINARINIEAHSEPGEFNYTVEVKDTESVITSDKVKLVLFDVAEVLGAPGQKILTGQSPTDIYTDTISEEEPGIHLQTFRGSYYTHIRKAPYISIEIEGSALIEVTFSGGIGTFPSFEETNTNSDSNRTPSYPFPGDNLYSNYVLGEGTHSVVIYPRDVFMWYRYGSSAIIRRIKIHPLPNNSFIADMRRDELAHRGSYTNGDIENLDFDGDGRSNLLEWMQSTDPFACDKAKEPYLPEFGDPILHYHFHRSQNIYPYGFCLEASTNLVNWEKVDAQVWEYGSSEGRHVYIKDNVLFGSVPRRFLRLKVYKTE